jgi:hypothetical protein
MRDMAKIPFPLDRISTQTTYDWPKTELQRMLKATRKDASVNMFVEDKLNTLEEVWNIISLLGGNVRTAKGSAIPRAPTFLYLATSQHTAARNEPLICT